MNRMQEDLQQFLEQVTLQAEEVLDSALVTLEKTFSNVEQGLDDLFEPIVHDLENQLDDLLAPIVTDLEAFEQSLEELVSPLTQQLKPLIDQQPACIGCRHYHGESYGGAFLVCGMHPYGVQTESCQDWEAG